MIEHIWATEKDVCLRYVMITEFILYFKQKFKRWDTTIAAKLVCN